MEWEKENRITTPVQKEESMEDEVDISRVTTAFKILGAEGDPAVRTIAQGLLKEVARRRADREADVEDFLNSSP